MNPNDGDMMKLAQEVRDLRREMNEMKELLRSLLQAIMEKEDDENEIYDFN